MKESLGVLEDRLRREIPEEHHRTIEEEFTRFSFEAERMSRDEDKIGQATLTNREVARLPTTNQHGGRGLTVIEWQAVKAAALKYGITDWTSYTDGRLTMEENINLMRKESTEGGQTMRELEHKLR